MNRYPAKVLFGKKFPEMPQQLPDGENIVPFPKGHFLQKLSHPIVRKIFYNFT
jgi:hypothetical protein